MDLITDIIRADTRIRRHIRATPLEPAPFLSETPDTQVFVKLENLQQTGSFKARGALNKVLSLTAEQQERGVVAASSGNHGAAVAFALSTVNASGIIFVPEGTSPTKLDLIRRYGGNVRFYGAESGESEVFARHYADEHNMVYISPYNDALVVAGQGTIGVEIARAMEQCDAVFVAVGGGGLIAGIASYLKAAFPAVQVIGCLPENSPVMAASMAAGHIIDMPIAPTLSDGTAGGIEAGALTFDLCRNLVDDYILVSEAEIAAAMRRFMAAHHMLIEGSAGVAIAAYLQQHERFVGKTSVIVICGGNVSLETVKSIL